jgi:hypothetical protein
MWNLIESRLERNSKKGVWRYADARDCGSVATNQHFAPPRHKGIKKGFLSDEQRGAVRTGADPLRRFVEEQLGGPELAEVATHKHELIPPSNAFRRRSSVRPGGPKPARPLDCDAPQGGSARPCFTTSCT